MRRSTAANWGFPNSSLAAVYMSHHRRMIGTIGTLPVGFPSCAGVAWASSAPLPLPASRTGRTAYPDAAFSQREQSPMPGGSPSAAECGHQPAPFDGSGPLNNRERMARRTPPTPVCAKGYHNLDGPDPAWPAKSTTPSVSAAINRKLLLFPGRSWWGYRRWANQRSTVGCRDTAAARGRYRQPRISPAPANWAICWPALLSARSASSNRSSGSMAVAALYPSPTAPALNHVLEAFRSKSDFNFKSILVSLAVDRDYPSEGRSLDVASNH